MMEGWMPQLSRKEWAFSIAVPAVSFGGVGLGVLLFTQGIIADAGSFYWGVLAGSFLLAYLAWIKPRRNIVALLAPLYAVIIFVIPLEVKPTVLLQVLFAASLTVLVIRLNIRFSTLPAKDKYEDPMEKFLYAYMHRITPYFRSIDSDTAHEIASAVLSFKFGIYPNTIGGADKAIARLKGEGAFATLRKALTIMRDRAESLERTAKWNRKFRDDDFFLAAAGTAGAGMLAGIRGAAGQSALVSITECKSTVSMTRGEDRRQNVFSPWWPSRTRSFLSCARRSTSSSSRTSSLRSISLRRPTRTPCAASSSSWRRGSRGR